jgi:hemolysin D
MGATSGDAGMTVRTPWASLGGAWSSGKKGALKSWNAVGSWIDHRVGGVPSESEAVGVARGFKPDADAIEEAPIPFSAYTVFYVVLALIVFAILWSIFGTLDRIVVAQGRVVTSQPVIVMQPFTISRISQIHVRPGQFVEAGQTLISFDPAFAQADEVSLDQRLRSLNAEIDRMEAELSGNDGFEPGPGADSETLAQAELFTGRKSQLEAELQVRKYRPSLMQSI